MTPRPSKPIDHAWGLSLGVHEAVLVRLVRKGSNFAVDQCRVVAVSAPDENEWSAAWTAAVRALPINSIDGPITVSITDALMLYRTLSVPAVEGEALHQMIEAQAEANLPASLDSLAWAWCRLSGGADAGQQRTLICATRQSVIDEAMAAVRPAQGQTTIVPSATAIAAAFAAVDSPAAATSLLIDIAAGHTTLLSVRGNEVIACATVDGGAIHLRDDPRSIDALMCEITDVYADMFSELSHEFRPQRALIHADVPDFSHLAESLSRLLAMPAERLAAESLHFHTQRPPTAPLAAIGAALIGMQPDRCPLLLNLRSAGHAADDERSEAHSFKPLSFAIAAVWLLAMLLALYALDVREARRVEQAVAQLRSTSESFGGVAQGLAVGRYLEQTVTPPMPVMEAVSQFAERQTILHAWHHRAGGEVSLSGKARSVNEFEGLMSRMSASPLFSDVQLRSATYEEQRREWTFEITANVAPVYRYLASAPSATSTIEAPVDAKTKALKQAPAAAETRAMGATSEPSMEAGS